MHARSRATTRSSASAVDGARRPRREDHRRRRARRVRRLRRAAVARRGRRAAARSTPNRGARPAPLPVRMGLHTGEAELRDGDYYGTALNRAARLMAAAHGGQMSCSQLDRGARPRRARPTASSSSISASTGCATSPAPSASSRCAPGLPRRVPAAALARRLPRQPAVAAHVVRRARRASSTRLADALATSRARDAHRRRRGRQDRASRSRPPPSCCRDSPTARGCASCAADERRRRVGPGRGRRRSAATQRRTVAGRRRVVEFLAGSTLLLVLDNCEHLLDAAGDLARSVLERARASRSSRRAARRSRSTASRSCRCASIARRRTPRSRMFDDRALVERASDRERRARRRSGAAIARDLPPARRHPARHRARRRARGRRCRPTEIARAPRRALPAPHRQAPADAVERQQTLRATVDWSYQLLDAGRAHGVRPARLLRAASTPRPRVRS